MDDYTQNEMHNLSCNYHWYVQMAKKKDCYNIVSVRIKIEHIDALEKRELC